MEVEVAAEPASNVVRRGIGLKIARMQALVAKAVSGAAAGVGVHRFMVVQEGTAVSQLVGAQVQMWVRPSLVGLATNADSKGTGQMLVQTDLLTTCCTAVSDFPEACYTEHMFEIVSELSMQSVN